MCQKVALLIVCVLANLEIPFWAPTSIPCLVDWSAFILCLSVFACSVAEANVELKVNS